MIRSSNYLVEINIFRGLLILLVVLGHSVNIFSGDIWIVSNYTNSMFVGVIQNYIYMFHMPAFFTISGFVYSHTSNQKKISVNDYLQLLNKKIKRVLIPVITIFVLNIPVQMFLMMRSEEEKNLEGIFYKVLINHDLWHLWFLLALFYMFMVFPIALPLIEKNNYLSLVIFFLLSLVNVDLPVPYLSQTLYFIFYFYLGFFLRRNNILYSSVRKQQIFVILLIHILIFIIKIYYIEGILLSKLLEIISATVSCYLYYLFVKYLANAHSKIITISKEVLNFLGDKSMIIFLLHIQPLILSYIFLKRYISLDIITMLFATFLCGLIVPIILDRYILKRSNIIKFLLGIR